MMNNTLAVIDLGTNTFHLLIVEREGNRFLPVHQERIAAKLGVGGINQNIITEAAITRALHALAQFKTRLDSHGPKEIFCFGTSAIRNATNKNELVGRIKNETGIEVTILSGDEEAQLIYKGVARAIAMGKEPHLIVDIGGGSVEFIIANEDVIFWKRSFEMGGQRLIEKFNPHDPITPNEINLLNQYFLEQLEPLFIELQKFSPKILIGSSGSFDTLSEMYSHESGIAYQPDSPETPFTLHRFYPIYERLVTKNRSERMQLAGMVELRVDMIVVGSCLIKFLLDNYSFESIRVSTYSLKEGVLATL
jgi:exopolyphosphatase / guanosine-5'-triphosphate,3'-diphosphate pyrophosphatase